MSDVINTATGELESYEGPAGAGLRNELTALNEGGSVSGFYSSMKSTTIAERVAVSVALSGSESLADAALARPINLANVIIQAADMKNEQTGQMQTVPRVVLVDEDNKAYHAISGPLYRDVTNALGTIGEPSTWGEPLVVQVNREGSGNRKYFTMKVLGLKSEVEAATAKK